MTSFSPAQQDLYNALMRADRSHVVITQKMINALDAGATPEWEDFGAPVSTPAWEAIAKAAKTFGRAIRATDDQAAARHARPVVDAVLTAKNA